ncbi:MAG: CotH kinase family protein, partial [Ignavibacteriota bacterium]
MKKIFLSLFLISIIAPLIFTQSEAVPFNSVDGSLITFTSSNLPIVIINTNGQEIPNEYKITADMGIIYNGEGVRNNLIDPYNNYNGKIGIEIRGSTSQWFPKKQYSVETRDLAGNDLDVSLLGFPEESDWILFAPYNDKSLMRDVLAYKIANSMGRYASRSKYCEVVLNNEYVGVYVLLEKVKRDANRISIKKLESSDISGDALTGGYIIKIDKTDGENNDGWYSTYLPYPQAPFSIFYQYHYPKPDDIVQQQKDYIQNKIFQFETMMAFASNISDSLTGYPKYIDTDSFVDFFLVNEIAKNVDAYRLSTYLYKDRDSRNTKIFAGPVWDFNISFGNADYYDGWLTNGWHLQYLTNYQNMPSDEPFLTPNWWRKLFDNTEFKNKVYTRWQNLKTNVVSTQQIYSYIDSLTTLLDESKTRNFEKWPVLGVYVWPNYYVGQTYQEEIAYLKNWISNRFNWMDNNMVGEPTGVENIQAEIPLEYSLEQNYPNPF